MKIYMDKGGGSGRGNGNGIGAWFEGRRITGSDRDFSLELDVGYRDRKGLPEGIYTMGENLFSTGGGVRGGGKAAGVAPAHPP